LTITYAIDVQMAHARPFSTFTLQGLSNGIKNTSRQCVLNFTIEFGSCGSPEGLQVPIFGSASLILTLASKWGCDTCHCMQVNQDDSQLLMVRSQIGSLTPDPSFDHNLCFKYPNGTYKPILNIYVTRVFQWYKELFNLMSFDPYNFLLKIQESIRNPAPKVSVHLGVSGFIPSHSPTLPRAWNVILGLQFWPAPL